jgi:hypothetical protein
LGKLGLTLEIASKEEIVSIVEKVKHQ